VLAWNLVNRYFIDKPRKLASRPEIEQEFLHRFPQVDGTEGDWNTVRFLHYYFSELARSELEYIVDRYSPRFIISLGEPVFRVLRQAYALQQGISVPPNLVEFCCEQTFQIGIAGRELIWLALPHQPTGNQSKHYKELLVEKLPLVAPWLTLGLGKESLTSIPNLNHHNTA
jgi:hypothetical protein